MKLKKFFGRLKNLNLLILSIIAVIANGRSVKKPQVFRKVLVFQNAKLGDMVCTTPLFRAIKKHKPEVKVFVAGDRVNKDLLLNNHDVDGYLISDLPPKQMAERIREENFDAALLILPSPDGLATLLSSGVPLIVAPRLANESSPFETAVYKILAFFTIRVWYQVGNYAAREYLKLLEPLGIFSSDTTKHLGFSEEGRMAVEEYVIKQDIFKEKKMIIGIAPSAGNKLKIWPAERFAEIADYLIQKYQAKVVLLGSEHDRPEIERMIKTMKEKNYINAVGVFTIDRLKAFIPRLSLLIAPDTGLIYIAETFLVPTIDIVGPMSEYEQPPRGDFHKVIFAPRKRPALGLINNRVTDMIELKRQINDITVDMVKLTINELVPRLGR